MESDRGQRYPGPPIDHLRTGDPQGQSVPTQMRVDHALHEEEDRNAGPYRGDDEPAPGWIAYERLVARYGRVHAVQANRVAVGILDRLSQLHDRLSLWSD